MSEEVKNILKYNHGEESVKFPFVIYAGTVSLLERTDTCHNNQENTLITKINKHTTCGYSLFTQCSFDSNRNKHDQR